MQKKGESGSPVLNKNCHVIGVMIKKDDEFTPIGTILKALSEANRTLK